MNSAIRTPLILLAALTLVAASGPVMAQGRHGGHGNGHEDWRGHPWHGHRGGWAPGLFWGGIGLGFAFSPYYVAPYPGYVVIERPPADEGAAPPVPAAPVPAPAPDPIIYPRNGQSPAQTETDRQECNRWATTQPRALADASVFQRATLACMEGRGYTVR